METQKPEHHSKIFALIDRYFFTGSAMAKVGKMFLAMSACIFVGVLAAIIMFAFLLSL